MRKNQGKGRFSSKENQVEDLAVKVATPEPDNNPLTAEMALVPKLREVNTLAVNDVTSEPHHVADMADELELQNDDENTTVKASSPEPQKKKQRKIMYQQEKEEKKMEKED